MSNFSFGFLPKVMFPELTEFDQCPLQESSKSWAIRGTGTVQYCPLTTARRHVVTLSLVLIGSEKGIRAGVHAQRCVQPARASKPNPQSESQNPRTAPHAATFRPQPRASPPSAQVPSPLPCALAPGPGTPPPRAAPPSLPARDTAVRSGQRY